MLEGTNDGEKDVSGATTIAEDDASVDLEPLEPV